MVPRERYGVYQRPAPSFSLNDLVIHARRAALELVEQLRQAETATNGWCDREMAVQQVTGALDQCLVELSKTDCWGEANRVPSSEVWRIAGQWLQRGELQWRARSKPRGYAGDYEMLRMMIQRQTAQDPLGAAFDEYFLSQAAPLAVCDRTELIAKKVIQCIDRSADDPFHLLSFGAGPALDVAQAVENLTPGQIKRLKVTLSDMDPAALAFAEALNRQHLSADCLTCQSANLFRLPDRFSNRHCFSPASILICTGLFDYLGDVEAARMLEFLWRHVAPSGTLIVGNFASHNPTRAYMEWIGNWYLTYRDREQFKQIAIDAGLGQEQFQIITDRTGVDLFLVAQR